jgi:phospholipid transport system substrate-binding protein
VFSRHRQRVLTGFFLSALALCASSPAFAGPPTDRLREFFAKVNAILADPSTSDQPLERVVRVRRLVAEIADMPAAAAAALGSEWDARTLSERDEFITLFAEVLERAYVARLAGAVRTTGSVVMTYGDEVVTGNDARVMTALRGHGPDLRVEYRMTLRGGRWRVRDIAIDGVSTVENYRAQFARLMQQGGYAGVVRQLRAKLGEETLLFAKSERPAPAIVSTPPADQQVAAVVPPELVRRVAPPRRRGRPPVEPVVPGPLPSAHAERVEPLPSPSAPRAEPVARPGPPAVVAVSKAAIVAREPEAPAPAVAAVHEPSALSIILGALLLGAAGAGSATVVRRHAGRRRHR